MSRKGRGVEYTPNAIANMADRSVGARDESNESSSQALMFCFDNAFPEKRVSF